MQVSVVSLKLLCKFRADCDMSLIPLLFRVLLHSSGRKFNAGYGAMLPPSTISCSHFGLCCELLFSLSIFGSDG
jgi:hypothetical protein